MTKRPTLNFTIASHVQLCFAAQEAWTHVNNAASLWVVLSHQRSLDKNPDFSIFNWQWLFSHQKWDMHCAHGFKELDELHPNLTTCVSLSVKTFMPFAFGFVCPSLTGRRERACPFCTGCPQTTNRFKHEPTAALKKCKEANAQGAMCPAVMNNAIRWISCGRICFCGSLISKDGDKSQSALVQVSASTWAARPTNIFCWTLALKVNDQHQGCMKDAKAFFTCEVGLHWNRTSIQMSIGKRCTMSNGETQCMFHIDIHSCDRIPWSLWQMHIAPDTDSHLHAPDVHECGRGVGKKPQILNWHLGNICLPWVQPHWMWQWWLRLCRKKIYWTNLDAISMQWPTPMESKSHHTLSFKMSKIGEWNFMTMKVPPRGQFVSWRTKWVSSWVWKKKCWAVKNCLVGALPTLQAGPGVFHSTFFPDIFPHTTHFLCPFAAVAAQQDFWQAVWDLGPEGWFLAWSVHPIHGLWLDLCEHGMLCTHVGHITQRCVAFSDFGVHHACGMQCRNSQWLVPPMFILGHICIHLGMCTCFIKRDEWQMDWFMSLHNACNKTPACVLDWPTEMCGKVPEWHDTKLHEKEERGSDNLFLIAHPSSAKMRWAFPHWAWSATPRMCRQGGWMEPKQTPNGAKMKICPVGNFWHCQSFCTAKMCLQKFPVTPVPANLCVWNCACQKCASREICPFLWSCSHQSHALPMKLFLGWLCWWNCTQESHSCKIWKVLAMPGCEDCACLWKLSLWTVPVVISILKMWPLTLDGGNETCFRGFLIRQRNGFCSNRFN